MVQDSTSKQISMPALFVGHGSPMNAIEDNEFSKAWLEVGRTLPRPDGILCISAHWETRGTAVTAMDQPRTIHDFGGFPRPLYEMQYPAPGSPALARLVQEAVRSTSVSLDQTWGLDHGAWSILSRLFPEAEIPVVQLSLDQTQEPDAHYALGKELRTLRDEGVLIVGSGNMVHNLGAMTMRDTGYDWAIDFDRTLSELILAGDHDALVRYRDLGRIASLAIPTNEHYLPLLYILGVQDKGEPIRFFADRLVLGSISMRSVWIG